VKEATVITTGQKETTLLTWRTHRLREDRQCLPLVIGAYVLAIGIWWLFFPVPLALFLPLVALTSALSEFLFPVTYTLTSTGVSVVYGPLHRLHLAWEEIKRAGQGADGVFLSPLTKPSRLDNFRGLRLRFPATEAEKESLRNIIREQMGEKIACH
jgi:hypothetical protein